MDDRVSHIAGHVEDAETGPPGDGLVGELTTIEAAGHYNISEQEIDGAAPVERLQSGDAIVCAHDLVAELLQYFCCIRSQSIIVLNQKNGLGASPSRKLVRFVNWRRFRFAY